MSSLDRGESVPLLYVEGRVSLSSIKGVDTLLVAEQSVSYAEREGVCQPLDREKRHTLLCGGKSLYTPFREERDISPLHITEGHSLLLSREDTLSLLYRGGVCLLYR